MPRPFRAWEAALDRLVDDETNERIDRAAQPARDDSLDAGTTRRAMNESSGPSVDRLEPVKRPKLFVGVWNDLNAYFPHLDGASVMTFEARDLGAIRFGPSAESALAWTLFLSRHTEIRGTFERARN